jgi:hypothetical protein
MQTTFRRLACSRKRQIAAWSGRKRPDLRAVLGFQQEATPEQVEAELERQNLQGTFRLLRAYWNNCGANSYK